MPSPQRLTALDATFLALSTPEVPFVVGCVLLLDRPPSYSVLATRIDELLDTLPRYRQRISRAPMFGSLAWIDDEEFSLFRHLGVLRVPAPGGERELDATVASVLTTTLPEMHPPWRVWMVEGLAGGQGALVAIVHHALVDGVAGVELLERILGIAPAIAVHPRGRSVEHGASGPLFTRIRQRVVADLRGRVAAWRKLANDPAPRHHLAVLGDLLWRGLHPASDLRLDGRSISSERSFAMVAIPLDDARTIKRACDVTINDVLLATVAGALRRQVVRAGHDPGQLDDARALVPVNRHARDEHATSGNRVALLMTELALDASDPRTRLQRIAATTRTLKQRDMAGAGDLLVALSDLTWSGLLANVFRLALWRRAFNLIITNIPGPPMPLYLLDARVTRIAPIVNLWPHMPIAIAIGSYAGTLTFTINADRAAIADLAPFVEDLEASFAELRAVAAEAR